ncbi:unnamed protein product, partial [Laminaria digitata]
RIYIRCSRTYGYTFVCFFQHHVGSLESEQSQDDKTEQQTTNSYERRAQRATQHSKLCRNEDSRSLHVFQRFPSDAAHSALSLASHIICERLQPKSSSDAAKNRHKKTSELQAEASDEQKKSIFYRPRNR